MTRYYSKTTGCTYLSAVHGSNMPQDAVEISDAVFLAVIANPAAGKVRSHADGIPVLVDPPPVSTEDLSDQERRWRDLELSEVTWLRDRHRDQKELGTQITLTPEQFNELLAYMQALRDWPQSETFPASEHRPVPPLWVAEQTQ